MKKFVKILPLCVLLLSGAGCSQNYYDNTNKSAVGTVAGALGGALVGAQFASSGGGKLVGGLIGATIGGFIGNKIGAKLDEHSRRRMEERTFYALNSGAIGNQYNWRTDRAEGYIIPTYEFKRYDEYCRNFTQVVKIDGKSQTIHGSACKQVDGTWRMVS